MASGRLDPEVALPALRELGGDDAVASDATLVDALDSERDHPAVYRLSQYLEGRLQREALRLHRQPTETTAVTRQLLGDLPVSGPLPWPEPRAAASKITTALSRLRDRLFLAPWADEVPGIVEVVDESLQRAAIEALESIEAWGVRVPLDRELLDDVYKQRQDRTREVLDVAADELPTELPTGLDEPLAREILAQRLTAAASPEGTPPDREEQQKVLDLLCTWPTPRVAGVLLDTVREPWAERRASRILTCRFGKPAIRDWAGWRPWLRQRDSEATIQLRNLEQLVAERSNELLLLWLAQQPEPDPQVEALLVGWHHDHVPPLDPEDFLERWASYISLAEGQVLSVEVPPPPSPAAVIETPPTALWQ
jgi:hypothetical protein